MAMKRRMYSTSRKGKFSKKSNGMVKKKSITKIVEASLAKKLEVNHYTTYAEFEIQNYPKEAFSRVKAGYMTNITNFPSQGDTSFQRDGKMIKNVNQVFKIKLKFMMNFLDTTLSTSSQIPFHTWRVIVWTSNKAVNPAANYDDFFKGNSDAIDLDIAGLNRTNIVVIKDKVFNVSNPNYLPGTAPQAAGAMPDPLCAVRYMTVKRRWKQITFPTEGSATPAKVNANTYLTILANRVSAHSASLGIGRASIRTVTYYTDA